MRNKRSHHLGAFENEFQYMAVGFAIINKACEDMALAYTDAFSRMKYGNKTLGALVKPAPQAFETLVPKEALYGDAQENSDESKPVFAVNSKVYLLPEIWPPTQVGRLLESSTDEDLRVICEADIDKKTEEDLIETVTFNLSMAEGLLAAFPEVPEAGDKMPYNAPEIIESTFEKEAPRIYRAIAEDVYLKWWSRYGKVDDDGELCVEVPVLVDLFVFNG